MAFEGFNFNLDEIIKFVWDTIITIGSIPISMWNNAPAWIHYTFIGFIVLMCIIIVILLFRYKDSWRTRMY